MNRPFTPDCVAPDPGEGEQVFEGDVAVTDAQPLPTSNDRCKGGGWRDFGGRFDQGDCVSLVSNGR